MSEEHEKASMLGHSEKKIGVKMASEGDEFKELKDGKKLEEVVPPDGGFWAMLVLFSCFLCNGIIFGILNTFGIVYVQLRQDMEAAGIQDAAFKCSLVGSLAIGATFFLSFIVGVIADKIGLRLTTVIGGSLCTLGMALSSVFYHKIEVLYLSYGVLFGTGSSLAYTPSLTILGHYFRKHMGVVNGIVTAGSSIFTILLTFLNKLMLAKYGLQGLTLMFTGLTSVLVLCGLTFTPVLPPTPRPKTKGSSKLADLAEKLIYLDNWRNKRYVIWALAIPAALFGYFVPYVHLVQYAKDVLQDEDLGVKGNKAASLVACIAITSGVGRFLFGWLADHEKVKRNGNRVILQQIAFLSIGLCTMLLTAASYFQPYTYQALIFFCCLMGLFDGCFITMLGPIAFDICGPAGAGQAIGFLLALCSVPLTVGPPIAGLIYDYVGNYYGAFIGAGVPPLIGAALMMFIRKFPQKSDPPCDERTEGSISLLTEKA